MVADYQHACGMSGNGWRNHPIRPGRDSATGRAALERRTIHIHDVQADPEYSFGAKDVEAFRTVLTVPMLKGDELLGVILTYSPGGQAVHRSANRAGRDLRRPGGHRDENVRLFDAERQHSRAERGAGAADRNLRGAASYFQLGGRPATHLRRPCWRMRRGSAGPSRNIEPGRRGRIAYCCPLQRTACTRRDPERASSSSQKPVAPTRRTKQVVHIDDIRTVQPHTLNVIRLRALGDRAARTHPRRTNAQGK